VSCVDLLAVSAAVVCHGKSIFSSDESPSEPEGKPHETPNPQGMINKSGLISLETRTIWRGIKQAEKRFQLAALQYQEVIKLFCYLFVLLVYAHKK
jgi:hypothetical protein